VLIFKHAVRSFSTTDARTSRASAPFRMTALSRVEIQLVTKSAASSGRILGALSEDVILGLFHAGPDVHMLPIVPDRHPGA
jgi:hypothetical protein